MLYFLAENFPEFRSLHVKVLGSVVIFTMARNFGHLTSRRKRSIKKSVERNVWAHKNKRE